MLRSYYFQQVLHGKHISRWHYDGLEKWYFIYVRSSFTQHCIKNPFHISRGIYIFKSYLLLLLLLLDIVNHLKGTSIIVMYLRPSHMSKDYKKIVFATDNISRPLYFACFDEKISIKFSHLDHKQMLFNYKTKHATYFT